MKAAVKKEDVLREFETMKLLEQDAHDFYVKASLDPTIMDDKTRNCFRKIAEDEKHHVERVDRIINIIKNYM